MLPYSFIASGTYTNPASLVNQLIALPARPDWFFVKDLTNWGAQSTAANPIYSEWFSNMNAGAYLALGQPSSTGAGVTTFASQGTSGGFTFIDQTNPPSFVKVAVTSVNGTTFVVATATTTGVNVGDYVRLINITGALEISGPTLFQVTAVSAGVSLTLGFAATAATAGWTIASGTTGFYQKVYPSNFYPTALPVLYVTQAAQAKVYFARQNNFTPGELVDFQVPTPFGMTQLSNLTAQPRGAARVLLSTNTTTESSITLDLDTTGFTAFVYPVSASFAGGASPPTCFPAGSGIVPFNGSASIPLSPPGTNLVDAFDNRNQYVMQIGTSAVGIASAKMQWFAFKSDFGASVNA